MKKISKFLPALIALIYPFFAFALEIDFPDIGGIKPTDQTGPAEWISYIFNFGMAIVGLAIIYSVVRAGIEWMTSGDNQTGITNAKGRIKGAVLGLLILLGSYVMLETINPNLVILKTPNVNIKVEEMDFRLFSGSKTPCSPDMRCQTGETCIDPKTMAAPSQDKSGYCVKLESGPAVSSSPSGTPVSSSGNIQKGKACNLDVKCENSVCIASNGDLIINSDITGICSDLLINGSVCITSNECFSGKCGDNKCDC